jgi:hypothetical protein
MPPALGSDEEAMSLALAEVGPDLRAALPPGETGEVERNWIVGVIRKLRNNPTLAVTRNGNWDNFNDPLNFKIRSGQQFTSDTLDLALLSSFQKNWNTFLRLRKEFDLPDLVWQQKVPTEDNWAYFTFGTKGLLWKRYLRPFVEATARELSEIDAIATAEGEKPLYQIEFPFAYIALVKLAMLHLTALQPLATPWAAKQVIRTLTESVPTGARTGGHLCRGNLDGDSLGKPRDTKEMVKLLNAIFSKWPKGRPHFEYVHLPLTSAKKPPPLYEDFYRPLGKLRLPPGCDLVAGILHPDLSRTDGLRILAWIRDLVDAPVHVASTCGYGRCTIPDTKTMLRLGASMCRPPQPGAGRWTRE